MVEHYIFPASYSNQITESYYYSLIGQINNGACTKKVSKILRSNGSYKYFTYHLISVL